MNQFYDPDVSFREEQRMPPLIPLMIGLFSPIISVIVLYYAFFVQLRPENTLPSWFGTGLIALVVLGDLAIAAVFFVTRLITEVRYGLLVIRFRPFAKREISYADILSVEPRPCAAILGLRGWGIKINKHGPAFLMGGKEGVQLELTGGKGFFVGSRKAEELAQAIKTRMG